MILSFLIFLDQDASKKETQLNEQQQSSSSATNSYSNRFGNTSGNHFRYHISSLTSTEL